MKVARPDKLIWRDADQDADQDVDQDDQDNIPDWLRVISNSIMHTKIDQIDCWVIFFSR